MTSEAKRLHPAAMILNIIKTIRQSIVGFLPLIILAVGEGAWMYALIAGGLIIAFIIIASVLSWLRYSYRLEEDQIRIEQGIIIRKKRTISKHRIQSIDLSQNIIHRIFGLTKVQIETAGSDHNIDASLAAVKMEEGKIVHDQLKYKKESIAVTEEDKAEAVTEQEEPASLASKTITTNELIIAGSTSGAFGIILGIFGIGFSQIESFIPDRLYTDVTSWLFSQAVQLLIAIGVFMLIVLWVLGVLATVIQHWKFTVTRYEKELFITRGLLEKKQSTIPLKRIQAVGIKESIIRQPLGFASVYVEIASGEVTNTQEMHTLIFPLLRKKHVQAFLEELLPEYEYSTDGMRKLPKRALPYYLFRAGILPLIATIVLAFIFPEFVWIPIIITLLFCLYGYSIYKSTGYLIKDNQLLIQSRMLGKDTAMIHRNRLQMMQKKQHILHRKQNLASLDTAILNKFLGRHFIVRELEAEQLYQITSWYSYSERTSS